MSLDWIKNMETNLKRAIDILQLIQSEPHTWTCGNLGIHFGCSKQQIHRYIKMLRKSGYDLQSSPSGYFLSAEKNRQLQ